jgi:hypothetical protein
MDSQVKRDRAGDRGDAAPGAAALERFPVGLVLLSVASLGAPMYISFAAYTNVLSLSLVAAIGSVACALFARRVPRKLDLACGTVGIGLIGFTIVYALRESATSWIAEPTHAVGAFAVAIGVSIAVAALGAMLDKTWLRTTGFVLVAFGVMFAGQHVVAKTNPTIDVYMFRGTRTARPQSVRRGGGPVR